MDDYMDYVLLTGVAATISGFYAYLNLLRLYHIRDTALDSMAKAGLPVKDNTTMFHDIYDAIANKDYYVDMAENYKSRKKRHLHCFGKN